MVMNQVAESARPQYPVMPDLAAGTHGFTHTLDSAIQALDRLGISESRITLMMAGPGYPTLQIVRQTPQSGATLGPAVAITLWVSGFGFFNSLPMPMRESGGESEMGTFEICQVFDDHIQKAAHWFRAGAPLFEIGPGHEAACRRWLSLFGIAHEDWPADLLYPLSMLAPTLSRMAGRDIGIRFAFLAILGTAVSRIRQKISYRVLDKDQRSLLGVRCCRIGRDFVAGDRLQDWNSITLLLGPVTLEKYKRLTAPEGKRLTELIVALCMSAYQSYSIHWLVGDANRPPRLGKPAENDRLGLNFHLGNGKPA
jgi:hypothetical protein